MIHNVVQVDSVIRVNKILFLVLSFCFSLGVFAQTSDKELKQRNAYQDAIIKANRFLEEKNYHASEKLLNKAIHISPEKPTAYYILSKVKFETGQLKDYEKTAEKAYIRDTSNDEYLNNLIQAYHQNNNNRLLKKYLLKAIPNHKSLDFKILLALTDMADFDEQGTINQLNEIERQNPDNEQVIQVKYQLYSILQKNDSAKNEIEKLIRNNPDQINYRIAYINTLRSLRDTTGVLKQLNVVDSLDQSLESGWGLRVQYLISKNNPEEIRSFLKSVINNNKVDTLRKYQILISITAQIKDKSIIDESIKDWIFTDNFSKIQYKYLLLYNYYEIVGDSEKAINHLRKYTGINVYDISAWTSILQYYYSKPDYDKCLKYCDTVEKYTRAPIVSYYRILVYYVQKRDQDLVREFKKSKIENDATDEMKTFLYNAVAYSYYNMGDMKNTFLYYEKILSIDSSDLIALNNYAYFLSVENKKLKKAERMSRLTIEKEPDNSTYLDTYAWILYQQKNYQDALYYVEEAIRKEGKANGEIMDHYGDILFALNRKSNALEAWKIARELEPNDKIAKKIKKNE